MCGLIPCKAGSVKGKKQHDMAMMLKFIASTFVHGFVLLSMATKIISILKQEKKRGSL